MSFINLLEDTIWSDSDITARTESMIHAEVPAIEENILNRKVTASALGQWTLTPEEQALLIKYTQACLLAHQAGVEARADMALLLDVLKVESEFISMEDKAWNLLYYNLTETMNRAVVSNSDKTEEELLAEQAQLDSEKAHAQEILDLMNKQSIKDLFEQRGRYPMNMLIIQESFPFEDQPIEMVQEEGSQ